MASVLEFHTETLRGCVVDRLVGEIDLSNAPALESHLTKLVEQGHVVVDLSRVTFLDSTALSAMIAAHHRADALGSSIRLASARGPVRKVLEVTQLIVMLDHHDELADALEAALAARDEDGDS